ncbi:histidine triad nucleotide-binding protein [Helicobacter sp. 11S02629-2]|uniref:histidine triad nucleotide-binding protein n=1 Tax=Helicobacter sp. 11S02629-2 TaxID=1476195 RepID=UPI000BA5F0D7|nr:histidine triad nucleotide-binding protein [Helicobacter sp. 11S02629-2]PAF45607.1 histidine triad nucleotide-binding protein [Helicobacter sp. 11S02629-2]
MTIFEKIVKGEIPCKKIHEDEKFLSFYDIAPKAPVHALIITKAPIKDFNDIDGETMKEMTAFIKEVVDILGVKESGYRLVTNTGKDSGQEVPHFHFHLLAKKPLSANFA